MSCASLNSPELNSSMVTSAESKSSTEEKNPGYVEYIKEYSGRLPWYDIRGKNKEAYVIGVCGGSASGKTTVSKNIIQKIKVPWVTVISLDSFYKVLSEEDHDSANRMEYDFDHPNAIDSELAAETILQLKKGKTVNVPIYDFTTHSRLENQYNTIYGANVIIVEGLMTFYYQKILDLLDLKIYVNTDPDLRLCRRIQRDIAERNRDLQSIILQYTRFVKPNFDKYISALEDLADIVIPWNNRNYQAVDMIGKLIIRNLENRGFMYRTQLLGNKELQSPNMKDLILVKQTQEVKILHTVMRNFKSSRTDFVNSSRRLMRLSLVDALSLIPTECNDENSNKSVCAVFVMRAGGPFEDVLKEMYFGYKTGQILIQHNESHGEPEFHYLHLPHDIKNMHVLLFDSTIATGSSAIMSLRILVDHHVQEDKIILVSLITTQTGLNAISNVFPQVKIVSTGVDNDINSNFHVVPGFGDMAKRYYGC